MTATVETVEIARSPDDVFAYLSELERHHEWQSALIDTEPSTEGPTRLGSRRRTRARSDGQETFTYEITEFEPPRRTSFKVMDGPIRPVGKVDVEPLDEGARSRVTLELDFEGHGIGKLLLPIVRRDAAQARPARPGELKEGSRRRLSRQRRRTSSQFRRCLTPGHGHAGHVRNRPCLPAPALTGRFRVGLSAVERCCTSVTGV